MDFVSPLLDLVKYLWGLASKPLGYICNLEDNVVALMHDAASMKRANEDVMTAVEHQERLGGTQGTNRLEHWLSKAEELDSSTYQVIEEALERGQIKCFSHYLPWNCWSSYTLGKRVDRLLNEVKELRHNRGGIDYFMPLPHFPRQVLKMPLDKTVGLDKSLNIVWHWLVDKKEARVIGLYGAGGVGKTTLMRGINEMFWQKRHEFDVVIWAVVSKQVNEDSIQDTIRKKLSIKDESWEEKSNDERVLLLREVLSKKKFVLLMDDVWASLELSQIGVLTSSLENGSKVVFTTRSKQVCYQMNANETFEVKCLMHEEALTLFKNIIGNSFRHFHPEIQELTNNIVRECQGLPLALITVGRAMVGRVNPDEWNHVLTMLSNNPYKLSGVAEEVYHILKVSYNSLQGHIVKHCFLYCCLFPEDYRIRTDNLIELWIGEGLLREPGDVYRDVYNMRYKGEYVLTTLEMACLLESGHDEYEGRYIKMHDVIRDMAIWITRDHGKMENKLLLIKNQEGMSTEMISKWREANKVSLWGKSIQNINETPLMCSQLETLFIRETNVTLVPKGFFDSMTGRLTVLNLSNNRHIKSFPKGICNLIHLQYLNLSATSISALPKKIKKLIHLRWLLLDNISGDILIPTEAIATLRLNVFSKFDWFPEGTGQAKEEEMIEKLGGMQHLTDLSINVKQSSSARKIFQCPNLRKRIRRAGISNMQNELTSNVISSSPSNSGSFLHLETLRLINCPELVKMEIIQEIRQASNWPCFPKLVTVVVYQCGLLDLSWLVRAPKLRRLTVIVCDSMVKIIGDGIAREELINSRLFSRLESLRLANLPKLKSICDHAVFFPEGVEFSILGCPELRKLPLDSNSERRSFSIEADQYIWPEFEWNPTARVTFQLDDEGPIVEEMTFGEALRKMKDETIGVARIRFLPCEQSE